MRYIDHSQGVPAQPSHWMLRSLLHFFLLWMIAAGPVLITTSAMFSEGSEFWIGLAIGIAVSLLMTPFGIWLSVSEIQEHKQTLRIQETGVPASAEVLAISAISSGEEARMALTLRVTGAGIAPFQAEYACAADSAVSVGDRIGALVDPATNAYAIPGFR